MGKGMSKVLEGLYVGCYADFTDEEQLSANKITHVISAVKIAPDIQLPSNISRIVIDINDNTSESISPHFLRCIEFIHRARAKGGSVLVHCMAGVSRSVTITAAYILAISDLNWREVLSCIRAARSVANPNFGFQHQLQEWCEVDRLACQELVKEWPPVPYCDAERLAQLRTKFENWVLSGEDEDAKLYPLAPGAYQVSSESEEIPSDTQKQTKGDKRREAVRQVVRNVKQQAGASLASCAESQTSSKLSELEKSKTCDQKMMRAVFSEPSCAAHASNKGTMRETSTPASSQVPGYQYVRSAEDLVEGKNLDTS
ncbi:dual specificity protein phosphatase 22-like isoform X2 [Watersipora subatra]|uniref:dual specificity protein phosphatase 22-like isoform X2 n=1 Tax=Watersipora subatra TaxID=2589382 RepID=UPI00355C2A0C